MKNKFIQIFTISIFFITLTSCTGNLSRYDSDAEKIEQLYVFNNFSKINLKGGYDVRLKQGDSLYVNVFASEKMQEKVEVWKEGNVLFVKTKFNDISANEIRLVIGFKEIDQLNVSGGINLLTDGYLDFEDFKLKVEGGANVHMQLRANDFESHAQGGVNLKFEGTTDTFTTKTEGAGNIDADNLKSRIVFCKVEGVGNATVYATEKLEAKLEGIGRISYRGNPVVNKSIEGLGVVHRK